MRELEYPFDANLIISKRKKLRKKLLEKKEENYIEKKIAILGGSTTKDIMLVLELFLLNNGIRPIFYESGYNQYYEDAMFENQCLVTFQPDVIYIHTTIRNITCFPQLSDSEKDIDEMLKKEAQKFVDIWDKLTVCFHCPIIQNNFEMPYYRLMGNKEADDVHGRVNYVNRLNAEFYKYSHVHENFYICDINYLSADYGLRNWSDPFYWYMYKYALSVPAIPYLSFNIANIIKSIFGKNKKGFVLDLDNTLWGGVIGDDGVDNIALGPEEPKGEAYTEFQKYIKMYQQLGIVLNVNSKNNYENAIDGLKHPNSVLAPDDFSIIKANWKSKSDNLGEIASDLNVLPESLVFIDDSPMERDIVRTQFSEISVPELNRIEHYIEIIDRSGFFEVTILSEEDKKRNSMYKQNIERVKMRNFYSDYNEYLKSLEMKAEIKQFGALYISRIVQLINKSNQFNLTTKRYTQNEIEKISKDVNHITLYGRLQDKFGDNGVVSVIIGHIVESVCDIELWLMSCRVLKRNMEYAMMDVLVQKCCQLGIKRIRGHYYPTAKNSIVKNFYYSMGFNKVQEDTLGNSEWQLEISDNYVMKNEVIELED